MEWTLYQNIEPSSLSPLHTGAKQVPRLVLDRDVMETLRIALQFLDPDWLNYLCHHPCLLGLCYRTDLRALRIFQFIWNGEIYDMVAAILHCRNGNVVNSIHSTEYTTNVWLKIKVKSQLWLLDT